MFVAETSGRFTGSRVASAGCPATSVAALVVSGVVGRLRALVAVLPIALILITAGRGPPS